MRVTPDRQTLILAGETPPRRSVAGLDPDGLESQGGSGSQRVTFFSARLDASVIVTRGEYTPNASVVAYDSQPGPSDLTAVASGSALPAAVSSITPSAAMTTTSPLASAALNRAYSNSAASAYARTQDLSARIPIIDTYA